MKVGILTYHNAQNYGAVLQCYALQQYIKKLGHDAIILDYRNERILLSYKLFRGRQLLVKNPFRFLFRLCSELVLIKFRQKRRTIFDDFIQKKIVLEDFSEKIINTIDLVIVGSDQVWNVHLTDGFHNPYWGCFPFRYDGRLISYAASVGQFWSNADDGIAHKYLLNFSSISVREENAAKYIANLTCKTIEIVADPTMLLNTTQWDGFSINPLFPQKYVLLYEVRRSHNALRIAKDIAKKNKIQLIRLPASIDRLSDIQYSNISPQEFLGYIKNAEYVICTSFHGTLFSIIFKRPFYAIYKNDGKNDRVENLLSIVNLKERIIDRVPTSELPIDWESVHKRLDDYKMASKIFLQKNLI